MIKLSYLFKRIRRLVFQDSRILKYKILSDLEIKPGTAVLNQPVLATGFGVIDIGKGTIFGVENSPGFFNGLTYLEARRKSSKIIIGRNVWFNNNFTAICDGSSISIGDDCLFGYNVSIFDSDFHGISPNERRSANYTIKDVKIGNNVFIGSNVSILKGVSLGDNSVVGNGSVVTKSFPENVIVGGNPAVFIKAIE